MYNIRQEPIKDIVILIFFIGVNYYHYHWNVTVKAIVHCVPVVACHNNQHY